MHDFLLIFIIGLLSFIHYIRQKSLINVAKKRILYCNILAPDLSNNKSMKNTNHRDVYPLIKQIQAGNRDAFRLIVDRYKRLVAHIVSRMISDTRDREDLCQDIFLKVYQNLDHFRFESKISTWIARIAYNTCINHLKKKKPLLLDDRVGEKKSIEYLSGDDTLPDVLTEQQDRTLLIETEINQMKIRYRTILTLFHLEEMSYTEISQIMELPLHTIKSDLFRARKRLREKLTTKYKKEEITS